MNENINDLKLHLYKYFNRKQFAFSKKICSENKNSIYEKLFFSLRYVTEDFYFIWKYSF